MNKIQFKQISLRNFLSIGDEPVLVTFKAGLNIITGNNRDKEDRRNGVGKSAIADAINFAIFGNTIRDIKKENVNNDCTGKKCEVILDFDVYTTNSKKEYRIVRTLNPSKVNIVIDGEDKTLDTIQNNNDFISGLLNSNQEVFDNCVIMTLNNTLPFMGKKKQDKRKFIESIFNLEVFSKMLVEAKSQYSEQKREFDVQSGKKTEVRNNLNILKSQYDNFNTRKNEKINNLQDRLKELSEQLDKSNLNLVKLSDINYQSKREEIQLRRSKYQNSMSTVMDDINELKRKISGFDGEISSLNKTISKVNSDSSKCPMCLRSITEDDKDHIAFEVTKIKNDIQALSQSKDDLKHKINEHEAVYESHKKDINEEDKKLSKLLVLENQYRDLQTQIERFKVQIYDLNEQIESTNKENNTFGELVEEQRNRLDAIINDIDISKSSLELLNNVKFVLSEEGVKSFLIKRILDILNSRLSYYLKKMDANCTCVFNEYFEETIINDKGKMCSYFNFSGAERKNIDLACLFTFMDIRRLQGDTSFNFSLYDELLDSSLDEKGIELVLDILQERIEKYSECIFVISHRKESTKFATGEIIMLEKYNGVTRRVEFTDS